MDCSKTVTKSGTPIKLLIGGSPCTKWSIAQKNGREVLPEGIGWELFENYRIAKEKFQPDIFLYENNKSAAQPIKDAIYSALGGGKDSSVRLTHIDSELVSAQHRQRFYVTNFGDIEQPEDRGILLRDVLESGKDLSCREKAYTLTASYGGAVAWNTLERNQRTMVAVPVCMRYQRSEEAKRVRKQYEAGDVHHGFHELSELHPRTDGKTNTLSTVLKDNPICEPVCVEYCGRMENVGGQGSKTKLYAIPVEFDGNIPIKAVSCADGKVYTVYEVRDGQITIKDKQYPIKLADGYYLIRKLTPLECERLQTLPDGYTSGVSDTQRYRALGNGWTAEVIIHILNHALKDVPRDKELVVLSMYDGIATGRYCLDKMGFTNVKYYAYEIDPYAQKIAMTNYLDIVQCGDAFQIRNL
jgi:DNA (cytosine-5)-methyltransferase 3A